MKIRIAIPLNTIATICSLVFVSAALFVVSGCSAADDYMEERKEARKEKNAKAEADAKEEARLKAIQERDDRRAATEKAWSPTNDIPMYIEMPMARFEETAASLTNTHKRLLDAQGLVAQMYGKYERMLKAGNEKQVGFARLLDLVEQARTKAEASGYPVAAGHLFIESEEDLEAKLADIREEMATAHTFEVKDEAMFNACIEARKHARAILKQFDIDYAEFMRTWDKVKLMKKGEIRGDLAEEVKSILDRTNVFIEQWNNPDTLRKL